MCFCQVIDDTNRPVCPLSIVNVTSMEFVMCYSIGQKVMVCYYRFVDFSFADSLEAFINHDRNQSLCYCVFSYRSF